MVYRSVDNGLTWALTPTKASDSELNFVKPVSALEAWIGGADGMMYHTADGGATWDRVRIPTALRLGGLHRVDASTWLVSAWDGALLRTTDAASSWSTDSHGSIVDLDARDDTVIIGAYGDGRLRVSTDGSTFSDITVTGMTPRNSRGVALVDDDSWIVVGDQGYIARTDDGGSS